MCAIIDKILYQHSSLIYHHSSVSRYHIDSLTKQETFAFYLHSNPDVNVLWRLLFNGVEIRTYFQAKSLQVSRIPPCVRDSREIQRDSIHNFNLPRAERKKRTRGLGKREAGMKDERATFGRKERPSGDVSRE